MRTLGNFLREALKRGTKPEGSTAPLSIKDERPSIDVPACIACVPGAVKFTESDYSLISDRGKEEYKIKIDVWGYYIDENGKKLYHASLSECLYVNEVNMGWQGNKVVNLIITGEHLYLYRNMNADGLITSNGKKILQVGEYEKHINGKKIKAHVEYSITPLD